MFEAGVPPESSLNDLFYVLKYDTQYIFDPQLIIEDLLNMRSYQIRKPLLHYLQRFKGDRAIEFILEIHDAILSVDQNREGASRYVGLYREWKEEEQTKEARNTRKKQEFQTRPYLSFENGTRGLCMVLPHTVMPNEWIDDVQWEIEMSDGSVITRKMTIFGDEGKRYVDTLTVPVCPSSTYKVSLVNNESISFEALNEWEISGIKNGSIMYFNPNGRLITPTYLQLPYGIMILSQGAQITENVNISLNNQSYPTDTPDFRIVSIEPLSKNATLSVSANGTSMSLHTRPQIDMKFKGRRLFNLLDSDNRLFLHIPRLQIELEEHSLISDLNIRIGGDKVDITDFFNNGIVDIDLSKFFVIEDYGTYGVRLYQNDHFLKQVEFSYVPEIETDYTPFVRWPEKNESLDRTYTFKRVDGWVLEFDGVPVNTDEEQYVIYSKSNRGFITGRLKPENDNSQFVCEFLLPINPFLLSVNNINGDLVEEKNTNSRLSLTDIDADEYWLSFQTFGEYKNSKYKLLLYTGNGIEQEVSISLSLNGGANYNLASFFDTVRKCPLPAQLILMCDDDERKQYPVVSFIEETKLKGRLGYVKGKNNDYITISVEDGRKDYLLTKFGITDFKKTLSKESAKLSKNQDRFGYPVNRLPNGLYSIDLDIDMGAFLFEEEDGIQITHNKNMLFVSGTDRNQPITSISAWIDLLIYEILSLGPTQDLKHKKAYSLKDALDTAPNKELSNEDYEKLVILAFFVEAKCIEKKKRQIRKCMKAISESILSALDRTNILRVISKIKMTQEVFDICFEEYNLLICEVGADDSTSIANGIEDYAPEVALLLLMGVNAPIRDTIWRDKYRDLIGKEAIRSLLWVPYKEDPSEIAIEQKKYLREEESEVYINLTSDLAGEMGPIINMLDLNSRLPHLDMSKKPDSGIYFLRMRYADQYVNWYSQTCAKDESKQEELRNKMIDVVKNNCQFILNFITLLKKDPDFEEIVTLYEKALALRTDGSDLLSSLQANRHNRYFYLQGMSALLALIPEKYSYYDYIRNAGVAFMKNALEIAPQMAKRDYLMAATFVYLKRKEQK